MLIPIRVRAGAWSGRREQKALEAAEVEQAIATVAERALRAGVRAGVDALLREALRLTALAGIALYEGPACVATAGQETPPLRRARASQVLRVRNGRTALVASAEPRGAAEREALTRLATFGDALLAARRREVAAQERQAERYRERQRLERALAYREQSRSRAAHDLRTPLLVIKGYVDMACKGKAGPLTPTLQRYLDRMKSASDDLATLIERRLSPEDAPEDLRPLLCAAFERLATSRNVSLRLEFMEKTVPLRGSRAALELLARTLARGVGATGATAVELRVDTPEQTRRWRLRMRAQPLRPLPVRTVRLLEQLARRLGGTLSVEDRPQWEVKLDLPTSNLPPPALATRGLG